MNSKEWLGDNNQIGIDIFESKYRKENESVEEFAERVSGGDQELKKLIIDKKFLFGGRVLANRGIEGGGNYYNCYSDGYIPDSMNGILDTVKTLGITYKSQGGQGVSLSKIRPEGTSVGKHYTSDGIIPFMRLFNEVTATVSQGGARKGALMMSIDIRHKEAEKFIKIKSQEKEIEKANLSLEIDDEFMIAVDKYYKTGEVITLHERREYSGHYIEYDIVPIELYKLMMETVYEWGEPGCIFTNQFRNYNLMELDDEYNVETCNPCGEQPLKAKTSCNLGSLNLYEFVKNKHRHDAFFDWYDFKHAIEIAVKGLDNIIDENLERIPLEEYRQNSINYRNIGLGVMGYADMLMALGLEYGHIGAQEFTDELFNEMFRAAVKASSQLAKKKGCFPKYKECIWESKIIKNHFNKSEIDILKNDGIRNCSLISIAPTGSIATMLGISGGIEPEFALSYTRRTDNLDDSYIIEAKVVKDYRKINNDKSNEDLQLPHYFITSSEIDWSLRVETQSIIQRHIDTAISSTVNLPEDITLKEIEQLYLYAWELNLKGITIFRDGCKRLGILLNNTDTSSAEPSPELNKTDTYKRGEIIKADDDVIGMKRKLTTGCGSLHCVVFFDPINGSLLETYLSKGSTGGCNNFMIGLSRMISMAARGGVGIEEIIDQLKSCGVCPSYAVRTAQKKDTSKGACCPTAVAYALKEMYDEMQNKLGLKQSKIIDKDAKLNKPITQSCPECGDPLIFEGGCNICRACGWSKCE